jgi:hypothetical protein
MAPPPFQFQGLRSWFHISFHACAAAKCSLASAGINNMEMNNSDRVSSSIPRSEVRATTSEFPNKKAQLSQTRAINGIISKPTIYWGILLVALMIVAFIAYRGTIWGKYHRIRSGMTLAEVEAIMGPGQRISREYVPRVPPYVKPQQGGDFATVVDGDEFYEWNYLRTNGPAIYVGFRDGKVSDKHWLQLGL